MPGISEKIVSCKGAGIYVFSKILPNYFTNYKSPRNQICFHIISNIDKLLSTNTIDKNLIKKDYCYTIRKAGLSCNNGNRKLIKNHLSFTENTICENCKSRKYKNDNCSDLGIYIYIFILFN